MSCFQTVTAGHTSHHGTILRGGPIHYRSCSTLRWRCTRQPRRRGVVEAPRASLTLARTASLSRKCEQGLASLVPTDLTLGGMLAAGAAASALQSFVDSNAQLVMDVSQKLSAQPLEMGMESWLMGLAMSSALQFAVSAGVDGFARAAFGADGARMPRVLKRAARALQAMPAEHGLVCRFAAKAVFFVVTQAMFAHAHAPAAATDSPFGGLPDLINLAAPGPDAGFVQPDDILSSTLQGLASGITTMARATSVVLDRAASTTLSRAMTAVLETAGSTSL